jgi:hypothetical protein
LASVALAAAGPPAIAASVAESAFVVAASSLASVALAAAGPPAIAAIVAASAFVVAASTQASLASGGIGVVASSPSALTSAEVVAVGDTVIDHETVCSCHYPVEPTLLHFPRFCSELR